LVGGQNLDHHPHVHCVVPGGGLSPDGQCWIACHPKFFLPVVALSRLFRGKFLDGLKRQRKLQLADKLLPLFDVPRSARNARSARTANSRAIL
jgi:hypothetical protein